MYNLLEKQEKADKMSLDVNEKLVFLTAEWQTLEKCKVHQESLTKRKNSIFRTYF